MKHGTPSCYATGCRRPECTRASALANKAYRLRILDGPVTMPTTGSIRRVQALTAIGWSQEAIAKAAGMHRGTMSCALYRQRSTSVEFHQRIADAYERLCMTPGPSSRARAHAEREGWAPPLAWDDIDNDPEPKGIRNVEGKTRVDIDEWLELVTAGEDGIRAARRLGVGIEAICQAARRNGRLDIAQRADAARSHTRRIA